MLALVISSLLISGALSATCNECWDEYSTCEWNAESSAWDECSQVWEEGSGYAPFNKECIEQQSQTAVQCYTNAGCFEAGNQDCWWKLWDLGCSPYKCEAYTICYENHKNEAGCDQQLQTCEQDCDDSDYDYGYDSGYNSGYNSGSYYYDDSGYDHNYDYYGSYNDNYYGSYDYNYYDEEWEYAEEEIPECIKEACETQLNQCASSDACIQGIENIVNTCYSEYEGSMECMDNLITESQGNGALELCEQNQECATDLQALGECVIQSANYGYCQEEETEKVKPKLLAKAVEAIKNKKANQLKRKNAALRNKQRTKQRQRPRLQRRPASRPKPVQRQRQRPKRQRGRPAARGISRRKLLSSGCCECTDPKKGPFCNEECDNEICPLDSYCCKHQWDWICADAAENVCNDEEAYGDTSSYNPYDYSGYDYSSNYDSYSYPNYDYSPYDYSPYDYSSNYDPYSYPSYDYSPYDSYNSDYNSYYSPSYDYSPYDPYSMPSDYSPYDFYGDDSYVPPSKRKVRARGRVQMRPRPHLRRRQRRGRRVKRVRPRGAVRQQRLRSKVQARQRHGLQRRARQQRSRLALLRRARQERKRRTRPAPKRKERRKLQSSEGCCECTDAKGSAFCNPECDAEICPLDSYCCNNSWDWICANAASNVCDGQDAYNYGPYSWDEPYYTPNEYGSDNSGSCCECTSSKGEANCNSACDQEICPLDPYCCNNQWDWICADAASNVCNGQDAYGYNSYNYPSYDYSSYDNYNYPSYDYSSYYPYSYSSYDYSGYDSYNYPSYDYSSYDSYYYPTPSPGYGYSSYDYSSYDYSGYDSYGYNYPSYDYSSYDSGYDNYYYPSYDYSGYDSYGSDYGYNNYDYSGYDYSGYDYSGYDSCGPDSCGSGYDEPEEWEYDEEEIPTCIKEACGTELAQCASSETCIEGIEGIANGCYNDNESPVECMNTLIAESEGNGALGLCNGNEQCATDLQALGECVIQSANYGMCENEPVKKKKELLKGLVKGLLRIKKQRVEGLKRRNKQKMAERNRREQRRVRPRPRPRQRPVRRERLSREERLSRDRARKASLARGASLAKRGRLQRRHRLRPRPRVERRERRERK